MITRVFSRVPDYAYLFVPFLAIGCGILIGQHGISIYSLVILPAVFIWYFLTRIPELALAICLVGFQFYVLIFGWAGISTSSETTLGYYLFIWSATVVAFLPKSYLGLSGVVNHSVWVPFTLFILWMLLNWFFLSIGSAFALTKMGYVPFLVFAPFTIGLLQTRLSVHGLASKVLILGSLGLILAFVELWLSGGVGSITTRFTGASNVNPLTFAYSAVLTAIAALVLGWKNGFAYRVFFLIVYIAVFFFVILSGSRGPLLALVLGSLVLLLVYQNNAVVTVLVTLMVFVFTTIGIQFIPSHSGVLYLDRILSTLHGVFSSPDSINAISVTGLRDVLWSEGIAAWVHSPVIGIGVGNFGQYSNLQWVHNFFIEILVELGIIGLILFLWLCIHFIRPIKTVTEGSNHSVAALFACGILVVALVKYSFSGMVQLAFELWFAFGLLVSLASSIDNIEETVR